jgi:hypothetical protein
VIFSTYRFKKIEECLSLIEGIEIQLDPRMFPSESQDSNIILYFKAPKKVYSSALIPVIYEKGGVSIEEGMIYEHSFRNLIKFINEIPTLRTSNPDGELKEISKKEFIAEITKQCLQKPIT